MAHQFNHVKMLEMAEPTTSSAAGSFALYKLAIAFGVPAGLAAIVVMLWIQPKSKREWAMALICTVVSSLCGGALAIDYLGLHHLAEGGISGLMAMGGIIFASGLPGWVIVRAGFAWAEKRQHMDIAELAEEAKSTFK